MSEVLHINFEKINAAFEALVPTPLHNLSKDLQGFRPQQFYYMCIVWCIHGLLTLVLRKFFSQRKINHMISMNVALFLTIISWIYFLKTDGIFWIFNTTGWDTKWQAFDLFLCDVICGYFLYDLYYCIKLRQWDTIFHHFLSLFGYGIYVNHNCAAKSILSAYATYEVSTPILNLRKIVCENEGRKLKNKSPILDWLFFSSFFFFRCICATILTTYVIVSKNNTLFVKILAVTLQLLSYYWMHILIKIARKVVSDKDKKKQ